MDKSSRDKLVTENMGYVVTLARQYKSDILSTDDLVSEGSIGLVKAAERFDPSRGKPFVTFAAPYIRRSIETAIQRLNQTPDHPGKPRRTGGSPTLRAVYRRLLQFRGDQGTAPRVSRR